MPSKMVRAQIGPEGLPIRIFRDKQWLNYPEDEIGWMSKAEAVGSIRAQVYERSRSLHGSGCERCGRSISWTTMEMHETVPKGKHGEVSVANCEALCRSCHQTGPDAAHKDRRWQTSKISPKGQNGTS